MIASVLFLSSFFVLKTMYNHGKGAERIAFQAVPISIFDIYAVKYASSLDKS
jgi:hypothetical protein